MFPSLRQSRNKHCPIRITHNTLVQHISPHTAPNMKTVIQRVKSASVTVDGQLISSIGKGLLVLAAVAKEDTPKEVESMAAKILKAKLWDDDKGGRWKCNVQDIEGEVLCVSQFTLLASIKKGNKPDFHRSAGANHAKELYAQFFAKTQALYRQDRVKDGVFQAMMDVALVNDGPVTIEIDTEPPKMDDPTTFEADGSDVLTYKGKMYKQFEMPASLLE